MPRAQDHAADCGWQLDQYPWECTCGAIADPNKFKPMWLKAPGGQMPDEEVKRN